MKTTKASTLSLRTNRKNRPSRKSTLRRSFLATSAAALLGLCLVPSSSQGGTVWDGGFGSGNWGDAANWNPDGVPVNTNALTFAGVVQTNTNNNLLNNVGGITFDPTAGSFILGGNAFTLSGGVGINNNSANLAQINNNITFAGPQVITANTANIILGGTVDANNGGVTFAAAANISLNNAISNTTTLTKSGNGTLNLANVLQGYTTASTSGGTISNGTLLLSGGGNALTSFFGTNTVNSSVTFNNAGGSTVQNTGALLNLGGSVNALTFGLTFSGSGSNTLSSAIQNGNTLTMNSTGTLTLAGANAFSTGVTINNGTITGGTLNVGGASAINDGGGNVAINSGIVATAANTTITSTNGGQTLTLGGTVDANNFGLTFSGAGNTTLATAIISGNTLAKSGAGTLTLANALHNFTSLSIGGGTIASGAIALSGGGNALTSSGGTNTVSSSVSFTNAGGSTIQNTGTLLNLNGSVNALNFALTIGGSGSDTLTSTILGGNTLTMNSTGTLTLAGANVFSTGVTINNGIITGGTLNVGGASAINDGGGNVAINSGIVATAAGTTITSTNGGQTLSLGGGINAQNNSLVFAGAGNTTVGSNITNGTTLDKNGAGTLTLNGTNTFSGATTVNGGTLRLGGSIGGGSTVAVVSGGTLAGTGTINGNATLTGTGIINFTNPGNIVGTLGVTGGNWNGAGTVGGNVNVTSGNLTIGNGANLTTNSTVNVSGAATFSAGDSASTITGNVNVTSSAQSTFNGVIAGVGSTVTVADGGFVGAAVSLGGAGANTYGGLTTVTSGALIISKASALGADGAGAAAQGTVVLNTGTLALNGGIAVGNEALTLNGAGTTNFVPASGALLNIVGSNSYAGAITLNSNATIAVNGGTTLALTGGIVKNGVTLTLTGRISTNGILNLSGTGISGAAANSDVIIDSLIVNENVANSYNGPTFIRSTLAAGSGILNANVVGALPLATRTAVTMDDSGLGASVLNLGAAQSVASLTGAGGPPASSVTLGANTLTIGNSLGGGATIFAGVISGSGGVTKDGTSHQILNGTNTYTGATNINGGVLTVGSVPGAGSIAAGSTVDVGTNGTLAGLGTINGNATLTGNGVISFTNGGNIVGTLTVTGGNWQGGAFGTGVGTVTGAVNVTSGNFFLGNSAVLNATTGMNVSGAATFSAGNTLTTLNGNLNYTSTGNSTFQGIIAGGTSTVTVNTGTSTTANSLTLSGNSTYGGATNVTSGLLIANSPNALGGTGTGTTVSGGASVEILGVNLAAEPMTLVGTGVTNGGVPQGALFGSGAASTTGLITLTGNALIGTDTVATTLTLSGGIATGGFAVTLGNLNSSTNAITVNTAPIAGTGSIIVNRGVTNLAVANTYTGTTNIINGGTLNANILGALPAPGSDGGAGTARTALLMDQAGTGSSLLNVNANQFIASLTSAGSSNVNIGVGNLTIGNAALASTTHLGTFTGTGTLTKDGASTQVLGAPSPTYTGPIFINTGGFLEITTGAGLTALGSAITGTTVNAGGALRLQPNATTGAEPLNLNGNGVGGIGGALVVQGPGTSIIGGPVTLGGAALSTTTIVSNPGVTIIFTGGINKDNRTLVFDGRGGGNFIVNTNPISGLTSFTSDFVVNGGTTTFGGENTYNGTTWIGNGGTLNANALAALPLTTAEGGSPGNGVVARTVVVLDPDTVANFPGAPASITPPTINTGSTLSLGFNQRIQSLASANSVGGKLSFVNLGNSTLTIGTGAGSTTFFGVIGGAATGGIIKDGLSTQILAGNNTYNGPTIVQGGHLQIGVGGVALTPGNLGVNSAVTVNAGAFLDLNLANNGTFTNNVLNNGTVRGINLLNNTQTVSGVITGSGNFLQSVEGLTIFTNINTYQGGTVIGNGTNVNRPQLQVGSGVQQGSVGTGNVTFNGGGALILVNVNGNVFPNNVSNTTVGNAVFRQDEAVGVTTTITGAITSAGGGQNLHFWHTGAGTTILTNAGNIYTSQFIDNTTIQGGILQIGTNASPSLAGANVAGRYISASLGGTLSLVNIVGNTLNNELANTLGGTGTVNVNSLNNNTLAGSITTFAGTIALNQIGSGTTTLTSALNAINGGVNVSNGSLIIGTAGTASRIDAAGAGAVSVGTGGVLSLVNLTASPFANNVSNGIGGLGTVNANSANNFTMSGILSNGALGTLALTQSGAARTILTGANTYTGATLVSGGILQIGNGTIGSIAVGSAVTVNPGAFLDISLGNNATFSNPVANNGTVRGINPVGNTQTVSGVISGTGNLIQAGGTTVITNINTYSGGSAVTGADSVLRVGTAALQGSLGSGPVSVSNNGGIGGLGLVNVAGNVFPNNISNAVGGLGVVGMQQGAGVTITLTGSLTSTGGGQDLVLLHSGFGTTILTNAGNTFSASPSSGVNTQIQNGTLQIGTNASPSLAGSNVASAAIGLDTGGTLVLVNIVGNTLNNPITNFFGATGTVDVNSLNNNTLTGQISANAGTISLIQRGTGSTTLTSATNAINGSVTVSNGSLILGTAALPSRISAAGATPVSVGTGGVLSLVNLVGNAIANNITNGIGGAGLVNVNSANTNTLSGILSNGALGTLALTQGGAGTTILTGVSTYTGATLVSGGTLQIGNGALSGSIANSASTTVNVGTFLDLNLATGGTFANSVINNGTVRGILAAGTQTASGVISGSGAFIQNAAGTTILTGNNTYAGTTTISAGTLQIGSGSTTGTLGAGAVTDNGALIFNRSNSMTVANAISGTGSVSQQGAGTTILTAANSYIGTTTVTAGTLQIGDGVTPGAGLALATSPAVSAGATLAINLLGGETFGNNVSVTGTGTVNGSSAFSQTLSGNITGTGTLTQSGAGTTILTGANIYGGTTTISAGTLQVGAGAAAGTLGSGAVIDNGALIFNRSDAVTVANAISGSGTVTKNGGGTTTLTGANTYAGATNVNVATLQIGNGATGNITSPQINVAAGSTLGVNLLSGSTLVGNIANGGTVLANPSVNAAQTQTISGNITGLGAFTQNGAGITNLTGISNYTGATTVTNGTLRVNGSLGATAVTVQTGATLGGSGTIGGAVSVQLGGNLAPGNSPGTLTVASLNLVAGSNSNFELNVPGVVGQASLPGNDLVNVTGNLVLAGNINVTQNPTISAGSYRLFNYGGVLTNNGTVIAVAPVAPGLSTQLVFGVTGQVNLLVLNAAAIGITQFWDGAHANNTTIEGGTASWDNFNNNWTNAAGTTNSSWQNGVANFGGVAGTVTLADTINAQGLVFGTTGYVIQGSGAFTLNLVGPTPAPTITVTGGLTATINAQITGSAGLTSDGGGTLVLGNAANAYTGGTTITGGGAVSIAADGALGATGAGNGITLNGGSLMATATFNSARTVALTGTGTVDVTNANVLTLSGIISGAAGNVLTKVDTGTLNLTNTNTYSGGTAIVAGIVQVANNNNLGNTVGALSFGGVAGGNATLQTLAGITSARGVTLNLGGGTVDTNGFNSTLSGIIGGAAGNPFTKAGLGTLTVTAASTYLGQTNVNAGTLQVGDGSAATTIGNNTATVVVNNGGTLGINLINNATFGNPVTDNAGGAVIGNNTVGNVQTVSGVISGGGSLTQSGAGTTILTGASTFSGATLVSAGTLQIGNGTVAGTSISNSVTTTVNVGGTLAINLAVGETFANNVTDNGAVNAISANGQFLTGVISGSGVLNKSGAGITVLAGNNTYSGVTTISAGTLQVGAGGATGTLGSGPVTDNATLTFLRSDVSTVANLISGTGVLGQVGAGTTILTAANTYSGATIVQLGTLQIGNGVTPGASLNILTAPAVSAGATLAINLVNGETFANNVTDNGSVNGINTGANVQTLSGVISGTGAVNQNGTGTTILTGTNSYVATTINQGTLQIGAGAGGGATGTLGSGAVTDSSALVINRSNAITIANAISGIGTLTQQGAGTTTYTGAGTYSGATNVNAGTLQIGNGTSGNITSGTINVLGGATLGVNLANNQTLVGNIANAGTVNANNLVGNTQVMSGAINGVGAFTQSGAGTTNLTGISNYTGTTTVSAGTLRVNGSLGATAVTVQSGGTLGGNGTIGGSVSILSGGNLAPGNSPGTLTVGSLLLVAGSNSNFELGVPGVVGQASLPGNDLVNVTGNLTLAGNVNVTQLAGFGAGTYRLFNYGGVLTNNGTTVVIAPLAPGLATQVITGVPNQVNLLVLNAAAIGLTQYWDGSGIANDNIIAGGNGTWDGFQNNWTTNTGAVNSAWQNGVAVFDRPAGGGAAGTVTLTNTINAQGLVFTTTGYVINGSGAFTLNLVGPTPAPTVTVNPGVIATINAQITSGLIPGAAGLTADGAGTLVLTNAANSYTGGTVITGTGTVSISSDGNLGNAAGALTLNNGTLQTITSFASARGITVTNTGTFDVTNANTFTANGIIGGTGALSKSNTGTLVLGNAVNSYTGPTNILDGTVRIAANGNLGAVTGGITFGGTAGSNAILQTTAGVTLGNRAVTLNTGGGTIDTGAFNSSLAGIIGGVAANPLTKIGAGTFTVTGASTYLGQTNVNGGTLQVGDGSLVTTKIGNNTATVVVNNGGTLAINLATGGIFGNPVTNNAGGSVIGNNTAGTQTLSGIISGGGLLTQNGTGTTILSAANSYSGATTVAFGTLQIGNGVAAGASIVNSVSTTVNLGAALAINLLTGETFTNSVTDNGAVNGVNTGANVQTLSGNISGSGTLNQTGTGTTILTGTNTYGGATSIVVGGTLQLGNGGASGTLGGGNVTDNGALIFKRSDTMTVANLITGTGTVSQQGTGVTILTNTNTYSGATTVTLGTLQIGNGTTVGSSIANTASTTVSLGAKLTINIADGETFVNNVTDNGTVNGISSGTQTLSGNITGTGVLNQNGTGTMILTGTNSYAGTTTITAGTLQIGAGGVLGTLGLGNVTDNGALVFNRSDVVTIGNLISGSGTLRQQGTGTTILTAANSYSGATTVAFGTLQIGNGAVANALIANSVTTTVNLGAALAINLVNGETFTNSVTDNGAVNGVNTGVNVQTLSGAISGSGTLNQTGTGTTILTGTNTYGGTTTIAAGTLQIGAGGTIGTLGSGNVVDNGALIFNRSNLMTVANTINGTGTVTQQGTGTTILTATNGYTGATTVAFGTLQIGDGATPNASIAASAVTVNVGAVLAINLANGETFVNNVADNGAVNGISVNTQTLSGVISGTGALNQNGIGKTILTGNNSYTGATTINAGTLQVGAGGVTGTLGNGGNVVDNGALIFNRSDAITVGNLISGSGTLTQQGGGTTTLTGANTYTGLTQVNNGTLQVGNGAIGNIQSGQINVAGGATFALNLANNQTLPGNIANLGTINAISANTQTFAGNISGTGVFNQTGAGITILTGASTYTGATTVVNGNLRVNGSLGNTAVTVQTGATLSGIGSIAGNVTILTGGNLNPGTSPGTLTTGNLVLNAGSNLNYELGVPGVIGQQVLPGNDLVNVNGNLTLDGNLNVTQLAGFGSGSYRLFNYTGTLINNIVDNITGVGAGFTPLIITQVPNQVILLTLTNGAGPVQFWDGGGLPNDGIVAGGTGNWDGFQTNWTNNVGNPNASWQNGRAIFAGTAGTVTAVTPVFAQDLFFLTDGYVVNGANGFGLNLVGPAPAPTINVIAAATATINAQVSGTNGLTSNGAGTLVLTNVGNNYTGGTVITGGGIVSISADGNLGALPGAPAAANITLNNGILQATATFALNVNRGITLAGAGGIDVTGANRFTVGSIISGPGSLSKTGTGILTLSGVNTYAGGTLILGGTLEISNNNNLGNVAGNVTFSNGATLKTLAGITSARAISLGAVANTGGGVIDTNGFDSTLTGVITGAAGNGLVKNGAGILTVTGASTYLGTTTINTGTLQVGDNATAGAQIGNNAANVIVGAGAILDVRLTNGGTFNNTIATALGATINSNNLAGATQTFGGVISGAGIFNQNGLGTAVLNGANTYTGQTNVNFGTVVLGNATALGTIAAGTVVASGATLDLNGQTVGAEALTIGGAGVGGNGALINGNIAVAASLAGPVTLTADTTITTNSANLNATPGGSILLSGNVSGGFGIVKNGNGTLTLTGLNIYTGQTLVNAGILQAGNNFALGSVGANTVVANGASLQILNNVAVVGEPVVLNGFGAGVAAPGALTQSLNGSSSLAGPITVATNANISTNGTGVMTLTGGITKNGTTLTINGGGTVNINGVGISGATSFTSDLVIDGAGIGGATVVNLNAASSYAGPTWITNGGTVNANVLGALPSLAADGGIAAIRTTVIMDPVAAIPGTPPATPAPSTGGSILNLGANQAIQSLTGAASSRVNLVTNRLTIGTALGGTTTFAGIISGANAAGASIVKDGTSTQIFSGPNTYTGSTTVNGGTLQAGIVTQAFGLNSAVTVGAAGTLELAGFSNTIGSLAGAAGAKVQSTGGVATLTTGALNTSTDYAGQLLDGAGGQLLLVKNGTGIQTLSGPAGNTYTGLTLVNAGELDLNKAAGFNAIGGNLTIGDGAGGANNDIVKLLAANQILPTSLVLIDGTSGRLDLNGFAQTIGSVADTGVVTANGSSINLGGGTLTTGAGGGANPANPSTTFSGAITGVGGNLIKEGTGTMTLAGAAPASNTYSGLTTVNAGQLDLNKTGGALAIGGNLTIGNGAGGGANSDIVRLLAANQIIPTSLVLINGTTGRLDLNGNNQTLGSVADTGAVVANGSSINLGNGTLTTGAGGGANPANPSTTFSGAITGAGGNFIKEGTGTMTLAGAAPASNTYSGLTTVNAGQLDLNKTGGALAIGGNLTIGNGAGGGANSDIVRLLGSNQILATSLVLINGTTGRLDLNGNSQTVGSVADTGVVTLGGSSINLGNGTLTTGAGGGANPANPSTAFSGVISGAGGNLTKAGTGTFTLNGLNTYTGATNVTGTLRAGSTQAFGINSAVTVNATGILDLAGNSNSIGSLAGAAGGFVRSSTGPATLTAGGDATSTAFAGVLQDNVGPLSLVKNGAGVQTLSGANTYTGTTTVNGGSLLAGSTSAFGVNSATTVNAGGTLDLGGNSNTIGSLSGVAGGTVQNSTGAPATLTTGGLNTSTTFSGTIRNGAGAPLAFVKNGTGFQTLSGANTFTGGTTLNTGTLGAGSGTAFGNGNLTVNGGTLRTVGGPLVVNIGNGNVAINAGIVVANVGGTIPGVQHDQITTTGSVGAIGGTLALVQQNGYQLAPGDKVNLVNATGGVAGGTALGTAVPAANVTGLAAFSSTPLLVPTVSLYLTTVTLEALQGSFAGLGGVFNGAGQFVAFTPNQIATARALDSVARGINFKTGILKEFNFLDTQPLSTLPGNLDKIAPEEFAAFFQNAVALANVQSANLERRMDDLRSQASAPSASGFAAAGSGPSYSGGLSGPVGKRSKEIAPPNDERWGAFLTGTGEFTRVGSTTNAAGFRFETSGVTGGLDYRVNEHFAIGMSFGYVGTTTSLVNGGKIDTDGGRLGLYATYFDQGFHVDAAVTGGLNSYNTRRITPNNTAATASPEGSEINVLIATGYDWKVGKFTVGPTASYQYTNVHTDGFTETGAFAPLSVNGQSTESSRTSLGVRAYYDAQVGGVTVRPELRLSWQHEFGDTAPTVTSRFVNLGGNPFTVTGPQTGRDSLLMGAGFTIMWNPRFATYLYYDGELGRSNYDSHNISGGIRLQF